MSFIKVLKWSSNSSFICRIYDSRFSIMKNNWKFPFVFLGVSQLAFYNIFLIRKYLKIGFSFIFDFDLNFGFSFSCILSLFTLSFDIDAYEAISAHGQLLFIFVKMCQKLLRRKTNWKCFIFFIGSTVSGRVPLSSPPARRLSRCALKMSTEKQIYLQSKREREREREGER